MRRRGDFELGPLDFVLAPGTWTLDANHSTVAFTIRHLGISKVRGTFGRFDAELHVGESLEDVAVTATIDIASIDTANADPRRV